MAATCTPSALLEDYKCLACLSEKELLAVLVLVANQLIGTYNLPEELDDLFSDSACFTCLSDKQKFQAIISAMSTVAYERSGKTIDEVRDEIKCMLCAPPGVLKGAAVLLLCQLTNGITPPS